MQEPPLHDDDRLLAHFQQELELAIRAAGADALQHSQEALSAVAGYSDWDDNSAVHDSLLRLQREVCSTASYADAAPSCV